MFYKQDTNNSMTFSRGKVLIVGGGIAGLCSAYYLLKSGWKVIVLDKGNLHDNCSVGNAGMIVPSHFTPLAAPGIVAQGIRWLFDNTSPFYLKPSLRGSFISWGIKFLMHSNINHARRAAPLLRDLNLLSSDLYKELANDLSGDFGLTNKGILMLYKTEKKAEEEYRLAQYAKTLGLDVNLLDKNEVQHIEPEIRLDVLGAAHYRCDGHLYPPALIELLINQVKGLGAEVITHTEVTEITSYSEKIFSVIAGERQFSADHFVIAGGASLQQILKKIKLNVPVMPGKGYSFLTDAFHGKIRHPALLLEARVALTPMGGRVRIGGTMELAPINHQININRIKGIIQSVPKYYPDFSSPMPETRQIWHGFRPCSPDGLPYLGRSTKFTNLFIAGGLGMMGLSLGPAVGKITSELINEQKPSSAIHLFLPERFN